MRDLAALEYPRHLHRGEESIIVHGPGVAAVCLLEGWTVEYHRAGDLPVQGDPPPVSVIVDTPEPVTPDAITAPVRRRKR